VLTSTKLMVIAGFVLMGCRRQRELEPLLEHAVRTSTVSLPAQFL